MSRARRPRAGAGGPHRATTNLDAFRISLSAGASPPADLPAPLAALWWTAWGSAGWDRAHALVQDEAGLDAAWVHAHLHRLEGDEANAAYWYTRAGRPTAAGDPLAERDAIAAALFAAG